MWANTLVHVFMYYYYYRTALGHSVWFKVCVSACVPVCMCTY
jgi:hypothetical protein